MKLTKFKCDGRKGRWSLKGSYNSSFGEGPGHSVDVGFKFQRGGLVSVMMVTFVETRLFNTVEGLHRGYRCSN